MLIFQNYSLFALLIRVMEVQAFIGGLPVLKDVNITNYNDQNLNQLLANASTEIVVPEIERKPFLIEHQHFHYTLLAKIGGKVI